MKQTFTILAALFLSAALFSQSPEKMSYQAIIRNSSNELIINHSIGMKVSILQGATNGTAVYIETQTPLTNSNGLASIEIGMGTIVSGSFEGINWANGPYFIQTEIDINGGSDYTISGTSQLLSVPYALYAKIAGNSFSGNYNDLINKPDLFDGQYSSLIETPTLALVATSGKYNDLTGKPALFDGNYENLTNKPIIPSKTSELINDKGFISGFPDSIVLKSPSGKKFVLTIDNSGNLITEMIIPDTIFGKLLDVEGNIYKTIIIGEQTWMAENLKVTKYNDNSSIPVDEIWDFPNSPAYCWYNNDIQNKDIYGALYNWYTINSSNNVCPIGWHVPTKLDWDILFDYIGGSTVAGGKLKESGNLHWIAPNTGATNETNFSALPSGFRLSLDITNSVGFHYMGYSGFWWSSTEYNEQYGYKLELLYTGNNIIFGSGDKTHGYSVRCIKD